MLNTLPETYLILEQQSTFVTKLTPSRVGSCCIHRQTTNNQIKSKQTKSQSKKIKATQNLCKTAARAG